MLTKTELKMLAASSRSREKGSLLSGFSLFLCGCMISHFSCVWLCKCMDCSPAGSFVHGILQARYWSGLTFLSLGDLPDPGIEPKVSYFSCFGRWVLYPLAPLRKPHYSGSVQFSHSVMSSSLQPHESQHTRPPCPSLSPGVHSNSHPSSQWCHPAISSSVIPFSSCPQSFPASESFPMSQLFTWGGQSTGVSALASFLPKNTQGWFPSE